MSADVAIVDYGIGNLLSVRRAFEHCGASVVVSDDPQVLFGRAAAGAAGRWRVCRRDAGFGATQS